MMCSLGCCFGLVFATLGTSAQPAYLFTRERAAVELHTVEQHGQQLRVSEKPMRFDIPEGVEGDLVCAAVSPDGKMIALGLGPKYGPGKNWIGVFRSNDRKLLWSDVRLDLTGRQWFAWHNSQTLDCWRTHNSDDYLRRSYLIESRNGAFIERVLIPVTGNATSTHFDVEQQGRRTVFVDDALKPRAEAAIHVVTRLHVPAAMATPGMTFSWNDFLPNLLSDCAAVSDTADRIVVDSKVDRESTFIYLDSGQWKVTRFPVGVGAWLLRFYGPWLVVGREGNGHKRVDIYETPGLKKVLSEQCDLFVTADNLSTLRAPDEE